MVPVKNKAQIRYMGGYRYLLVAVYSVQTKISGQRIDSEYINLQTDGMLTIEAGYCWDGASGPAVDTNTIMRGSLIHDALYQLLRMEFLAEEFRQASDRELYRACREDGMGWFRAKYVYRAVRLFGRSSAAAENRRQVQVAP